MSGRTYIGALLLGLLGMGWLGGGCAAPPAAPAALDRFEFTRPQMGVPFRIVLYAPDPVVAAEAAEAAFARVVELNRILSDYDPESEINRLCHDTPVGQPVRISPELGFMLERSLALSAASDGAFDVTIGPLVNLWRRARRHQELPAEPLLAEARERVGWRRLRLEARSQQVTLLAPGMRLDFGGIAKGYASDEALRVLRARGLTRALVGAAGDIAVGDAPPAQRGWRVEVGGSDAPGAPAPRLAWLHNAAVSTGGDTFQRLEIGGRRYSHIVDPRTGIGLTDHSLVTVIAPDATTTDGLETAVSVLGPEAGLKLVKRYRGAEVLILREVEGRLEVHESAGFARWAPRPR